ncbi:hypothetical protein RO3G_04466 [Rhizopus delemar RA 99-880]|uniref:Uncharacterized protein n=1 Tax=Rhizopus delemar (strain RA 99-880 / ATCC MYA-4621 / FGSC 9543 / NRRL 43880) TaxID=246409 RepID=I1BU81_RHIO9|nr:hypothetical protein RO3G_04466 [Rhizopus delemar RA 99-880]|eukprot:EIE79761.1 hypothetical protein RO3G_04466 [Rhizopus delemar RA 99-880]
MEELIIKYAGIAEGTSENNKPVPKGTITVRFVKFMSEHLDIMDLDRNLMGNYLVMDSCSIHRLQSMFRKIESRDYREKEELPLDDWEEFVERRIADAFVIYHRYRLVHEQFFIDEVEI